MDSAVYWKELEENAKTLKDSKSFFKIYRSFLKNFLSDFKQLYFLAKLSNQENKVFQKAIFYITRGNVVEVSSLPQLEIALLASLYFIAQGKRVFVFTREPIEFSPNQEEILRVYNEALGVRIGVVQRTTSKETKREAYANELVLSDYIQFSKDFYADRNLVEERPTVAIICEIDLCLYDRRIFFFEKEDLRATAAIYRTRAEGPISRSRGNIFDYKEIVPLFNQICGLSSSIISCVKRELIKTYGITVKTVGRKRWYGGIPAFVFKTKEEKFKVLSEDITQVKDDILVFYSSQETLHLLMSEFKNKRCGVIPIFSDSDFKNFFNQNKDKKLVGLVQGLRGIDSPFFLKEKRVAVFLAEHFPFLHHHTKIKIFCKKKLNCQLPLYLYFSLEDAVAKIYTDYFERADFSHLFALMQFVERRYSIRCIRRWTARRILRSIYRLRRFFWNEGYPILTTVFAPAPQDVKERNHLGKKLGKRLDALCFCGSGKKFKNCHGKQ